MAWWEFAAEGTRPLGRGQRTGIGHWEHQWLVRVATPPAERGPGASVESRPAWQGLQSGVGCQDGPSWLRPRKPSCEGTQGVRDKNWNEIQGVLVHRRVHAPWPYSERQFHMTPGSCRKSGPCCSPGRGCAWPALERRRPASLRLCAAARRRRGWARVTSQRPCGFRQARARKRVRTKGADLPCKEQAMVTPGVIRERDGHVPQGGARTAETAAGRTDFLLGLAAVVN